MNEAMPPNDVTVSPIAQSCVTRHSGNERKRVRTDAASHLDVIGPGRVLEEKGGKKKSPPSGRSQMMLLDGIGSDLEEKGPKKKSPHPVTLRGLLRVEET
jgi:hypothetical protein